MRNRLEKEITHIHSQCACRDDYMNAFISAFKEFISPRISNYFFELNNWESDLRYLRGVVSEHELSTSDWILFVADYSRKALDEDIGSIQARDSLDTYMKLVRN